MISNADNTVSYSTDGSTTEFAITIDYHDESDIHVYIRNNSTDAQDELINPDEFTVDTINDTITTVDTWDSGYTLLIVCEPTLTQTLDLNEGEEFPSDDTENRLDRFQKQIHYLFWLISRAILLPETYSGTVPDFPEPSDGYFLEWVGSVLTNVQHVSGTVTLPADTIHDVGDTGEPAFENSWDNEGGVYEDAGFYKNAEGFVLLQGTVNGGLANTVVYTLPSGYRPSNTIRLPVVSEVACHVEINANGEVKVVA